MNFTEWKTCVEFLIKLPILLDFLSLLIKLMGEDSQGHGKMLLPVMSTGNYNYASRMITVVTIEEHVGLGHGLGHFSIHSAD